MARPDMDDGARPESIEAATLRRAVALVSLARDPALPGIAMGLGLALAGCLLAVFSGFSAVGVQAVALQTPYLVSGGLGGIALVVVGVMLAAIQVQRRDDVDATGEMGQVTSSLTALVEAAVARRHSR